MAFKRYCKMSNDIGYTIAWWSGGITSAVACRLALEKYDNVRIVYIETGSHHEDTMRFKSDCEKWYNCEIETIQNSKYVNHFDVYKKVKYVNSPHGATCTKVLKKDVRFKFEKNNNIKAQVWGFEFEAKEINRAIRTQEQYPETNPLFPLIENKLSKNECAGILAGAGIEIPKMYKLGYNNNNCVGCVKGGAGYWNKIRIDFPEIFKEMSIIEREVGATCLKDKNGKIYLDELNPSAGNHTEIVLQECGIFCQVEFAHIMSNKTDEILKGNKSIYDFK
jgi:3'-phosphoadenosine 5'-phosphosulfate sulfotransferase (PAPS reductase)/FAD synthetase